MDRTSLTFIAFKNSTYNLIGYIWPIIFTLFVTPLIIFNLGVKQYGIYLFVNAVISLIGLIDLGLGLAVSKHMSYYFGKKDDASIRRLAHSANSLFLIIGLAGLAVSFLITAAGSSLMPEKFAEYQEYAVLFFIGGGVYFLNTVCATYSSALFAIQRFDLTNKIGMSSITATSLSTLAIVKLGGGLTGIFLAQLAISGIIAAITFYLGRKLMPAATIRLGWDKKK